ncbi:50S ribosomal protein L14 [Candidatus Termititenax persephonae]|uniref:Large ribosomal subunit protein uL14 n=1 Tax=Candidatus Termititenax persephonae TaxID=2218525 RepID=A0A388TG12_9BACT|nr:50S ribosomal protein L14 [Candidatus Termititenax persephonae]
MLQRESRMVVADNSGAREALIMHIPGNSYQKEVSVGSIVTVVIKKASVGMTVKKAEVQKAVVVRTKRPLRRPDGTYLRFDDNACVIIDPKTKEPKGTRIFGPVARELKDRGYAKIISRASEVL